MGDAVWNEGDPLPHQHPGSTDACFEDDEPSARGIRVTPDTGMKEETMDAGRTEADAFIDHDWRDCNCALHGPRTFDYHTHAQYRSEEQRCDVCIAKGRADALREAADRFKAAHDGVCACPADGTDPDCHWPCVNSARAILDPQP